MSDADFYLASASPRRRELLLQVGARFAVLPPPDVDEAPLAGEAPLAYVERIARAKARAGLARAAADRLAPRPVLAADTAVVVDGGVLGKPRDAAEAFAYLRRYSGRSHEVLTCIAVGTSAFAVQAEISVSEVTFRTLDAGEIARYVATGDPFDKAGGYGIQGRAALFVARICGSYSGIMGLALEPTARLLAAAGVVLG